MHISMVLISAVALGVMPLQMARAQQPDIQRTDLIRSDVSTAGKEVVQIRVDFNPGAFAARHKHPGEEVAFVLEGSLEYQLEGHDPAVLKAGQSLFIPAGTPHSARNVGGGKASELATYVVSKGEALIEPVK
jgi:quercetin dioxygenase-like cupin family protein